MKVILKNDGKNLKNVKAKVIKLLVVYIVIFYPVFTVGAQDFHINYSSEQVSSSYQITMKDGEIKEYNVSITDVNSTMSVIVEILDNSGPLWGLYLEKASIYYSLNHSLAELDSCCTKYADHVSLYTNIHINLEKDSNYVLAFYNTHGHLSPDTYFNATILNGLVGSPFNVEAPPSDLENFVLYIILPPATLAIIIIFGFQILKIKNRKKN